MGTLSSRILYMLNYEWPGFVVAIVTGLLLALIYVALFTATVRYIEIELGWPWYLILPFAVLWPAVVPLTLLVLLFIKAASLGENLAEQCIDWRYQCEEWRQARDSGNG